MLELSFCPENLCVGVQKTVHGDDAVYPLVRKKKEVIASAGNPRNSSGVGIDCAKM
ncbi:MAG: hypothetical protein KAT01_09595 [Candidatus Aminicenantes bacterium]|nr:hypothetical protein [Candidatus Aminicenantes bacterium]